MNKLGLEYEPPKTKIYRFDKNNRPLTESGIANPTAEYAAHALNAFMEGTNTTFEDDRN